MMCRNRMLVWVMAVAVLVLHHTTLAQGATTEGTDGATAENADTTTLGQSENAAGEVETTLGPVEGTLADTGASESVAPVGDTSTAAPAAPAAAAAAAAATTAGAGDEATAGGDVTTIGAGDEQTEGAGTESPAAATEGATSDEPGTATQAAGGASAAADSSTESSQGPAAAGEATSAGETATAGTEEEEAATTVKAESEETTKGTESEVTAAVVEAETRAPPEATYTVTSILVPPYLMLNETDNTYYGFIADILKRLEIIMNVELKLKDIHPSTSTYGKLEDGQWTGMIGQVARGEVDLAAAPLTVTVEREEVVDFTHPFISYTIAAVIHNRDLYSYPRTESLEDLLNLNFHFGVTKDSNIYKVLKASKDQVLERVYQNIVSHSGGLKDNNNDGIRRVRYDLKYAFLMESTAADWISHQEPCGLKTINSDIYKRKYAFAVQDLSKNRDRFNVGITKMQQLNGLDDLQDKWFRGHECNGCDIMGSSVFSMVGLVCLSLLSVYWV